MSNPAPPINVGLVIQAQQLNCECASLPTNPSAAQVATYNACRANQTNCYQPIIQEMNKAQEERNRAKVGIYAGTIMGALLVVFIIVYYFLKIRPKRANMKGQTKGQTMKA